MRRLPTPCARDHKGAGYSSDLPAAVALLPTPTASRYGTNTSSSGRRHPGLDQMARRALLPTPQVADADMSGNTTPAARSAAGHQVNLTHLACHPPLTPPAPTPAARPRPDRLLPTPRATDADKGSPGQHGRRGDPTLPSASAALHARTEGLDHRRVATGRQQWGPYLPAIQAWEHLLGRRAPAPTEPGRTGRPRLAAPFVEWLMGLPRSWITDLPLPRSAQLRALGNGVVPQQAAAALHHLLHLATAHPTTDDQTIPDQTASDRTGRGRPTAA